MVVAFFENRDSFRGKLLESDVIEQFLPEVKIICANKTRAGILHLLLGSEETLHSMQVEELCYRLGIRPTVCIHHLEKLSEWKLIEVKKNQKYGDKHRRTIWGLNLNYSKWVAECYKVATKYFFTRKQLALITNRNISFR